MAQRELKVQAEICRSVREQEGYARKLSNRFLVGFPDLIIILKDSAACFAEVKDLGIVTENFDQKIEISPKQQHELKEMAAPTKDLHHNTFILVKFEREEIHYLAILPSTAERLSWAALKSNGMFIQRAIGLFWDIRLLFRHYSAFSGKGPASLSKTIIPTY